MTVDLLKSRSFAAAEGYGPQKTRIRAMERSDLPAIGRLFGKVFRQRDREAGSDLTRYLEAVFFGSPHYAPEYGSIVHENSAGSIDSAILSLPMEFTVHGRSVMARLLCAFMVDGKAGAAGAARLARTVRAARQEMCFSDNSSPASADHCIAGGGVVLPIQSLEWRRSLRPLVATALLAGRRIPLLKSRVAVGTLGVIDRILRRWRPSPEPALPSGCRTDTASPEAFFHCAPPMLARFSVRPAWTRREFDWLIGVASQNRSLGALQCRTVSCENGRMIGAFLFFGKAQRTATVLNVICDEGREFDVTAAMFACLDEEGYAVATGMAQPFLMNAISRQRWLSFRHRGYFCLVTRHPDLKDAALGNDIYIGGLASESWSRLLTDF